MTRTTSSLAVAALVVALGAGAADATELPASVREQLASATYVYIATQRKDGSFGKPDGPSFAAVGSIVTDPKVADLLFETYAKKYPDRWPGYAQKFKDGIKDGSRVLVKYVPK